MFLIFVTFPVERFIPSENFFRFFCKGRFFFWIFPAVPRESPLTNLGKWYSDQTSKVTPKCHLNMEVNIKNRRKIQPKPAIHRIAPKKPKLSKGSQYDDMWHSDISHPSAWFATGYKVSIYIYLFYINVPITKSVEDSNAHCSIYVFNMYIHYYRHYICIYTPFYFLVLCHGFFDVSIFGMAPSPSFL